jgi:hypothetical protein
MEAGSKTLQSVIQTSGLSFEKVSNIMDDVEETLQTSSEIESAIATGNEAIVDAAGVDLSDSELEEELEKLLQEGRPKKQHASVNEDQVIQTLNTIVPPSTLPKEKADDIVNMMNEMTLAS